MSCLWPGRGLSNGPSPKSYHSTNSTSSPQSLLCPVSTIHLTQQRFCYVCCRGQRGLKTINQRICLLQFLGNLCNKYSKYFSRRSATASTSAWCLHWLYVEHNNKSQYQTPQSAGTTHNPHNKQTWAQINQKSKKYLSKLWIKYFDI